MAFPQDCLGMHFTAKTLACAAMHHRGSRHHIQYLGHIDFQLAVDDAGAVTQPDQQGRQLHQALQREHYHFPRLVALALPEEHCFQLTVGIQQPDAATNLAEAVRWEAAQHLPYDMNEMILDWTTISTDKTTLLIQVCAAPKALVESYCTLLDAAGYTPTAIEPLSYAAIRTLTLPPLDPIICVVLGETSTTLTVVSGSSIPLTTNSRFCTNQRITDLFLEKLHLSPHDAEKAKSVCGFDPSINHGEVRAVLMDELRGLLAEITSAQTFLTEHDASVALRGVVLTGPGSLVRNINLELAEQLHLPVFLHPLRKGLAIAHTAPRDTARRIAQYASSIGTALHQ